MVPPITPPSTAQSTAALLAEYSPVIARLEADLLAATTPRLTLRQFRILRRIDEGHRSLSEIRRLASTSLASISESVEALVRRGLVTRSVDPIDRRRARLALSDDGIAALEAGHRCLADVERRLAALVPDPDGSVAAALAHLVALPATVGDAQ